MAKDVILPQLGKSMTEGTIVKLCVEMGQTIAAGDVVFEIETDKATMEVETPDGGCVRAVLVDVGQTVPINTPVLVLGEADEDVTAYLEDKIRHTHDPAEAVVAATQKGVPPQVQAVAKEMDVDLTTAAPAEAIRTVDAHVRKEPDAGAVEEYQFGQTIPLTRLQKVTAQKMVWSKQNIPCFYLNVRVNMSRLIEFRTQWNEQAAAKISFNDLILRALTLAVKHYPIMTGKLQEDHIQLSETVDIGLAIATDDGLVAPILKGCGGKSLAELSAACQALIEKAKAKKLDVTDLEGGCLTVSNLGGFGVDSFIPVVVPGHTSILGVGMIQDAVLPVDKAPSMEKTMNLTLSVDHKVVNGAEAAQFLDLVKKMLEHPDELVPAEQRPKAEEPQPLAVSVKPVKTMAESRSLIQKIFGGLFRK
ncbi:MAG: dihydrolipoamide acetyltransferase family protein [Planctomycetota bacterium]|jgi:pyruvate dehydrogenase E2 component (dihydrolipoamide acetyltransferase)